MTAPVRKYHVDERSILFPSLERFVWKPMLAWIPPRASANTLTLLGALLSALASAALVFARDVRVSWVLAACLYFAYLCLDNLDGPQARRTSGGTRLGEVLDHWLDSLSGMLLFAAQLWAFQIFGVKGLLVMALAAASYQATFWEQRVTGTMVLGTIGYVEGLVMLCSLCLASAILGPEVLVSPLPIVGITPAQIVFVFVVATLIWTILAAVWRVRRRLGALVMLLSAPAVAFVWATREDLSFGLGVLLFVLLTPATAGRLLIAKVAGWRHFGIDWILVGAIVLVGGTLSVTNPLAHTQNVWLTALVVLAALRVGGDFLSTLWSHRSELHSRELLGRLLRVSAAESRVESRWPMAERSES